MGDAECVPENHICVDQIGRGIRLDPSRDTLGRFARSLWDVAASRMKLGIVVCSMSVLDFRNFNDALTFGNVHSVSREACSLPY